MKLTTTRNPNFKWYNPASWKKVPMLIIQKGDIVKVDKLTIERGILTHEGRLDLQKLSDLIVE